jgi:uncharacterized protein with FMN-binding domain
MNQPKKLHPAITALIIIVLVGVVASAVIIINMQPQNNQPDTSTQDATQIDSSDPVVMGNYKDGTYQATGSYSTPGGRESINLRVTLKGGVITATSLVQNARDGESKFYQNAFDGSYKDLVVSKSVDQVSLSRVAGSSLTSNGFNQALDQIKEDASAA